MRFALLSTLLIVATPAFAGEEKAPEAASAPKAEKKICKREAASESRLGARRICRTAEEWRRAENSSNRSRRPSRDGS